MQQSHFNRVSNLPKPVEALRKKYCYQATNLIVKSTNLQRANTAATPITDEENRSSYSGIVSIGTPPNLMFIIVTVINITSGLINDGHSGIMGLGLTSISPLRTNPFWEALYNGNNLSEPLFSFYLECHADQPSQISAAPGSMLTLGGTNSSLYQGSIECLNLTSPSSRSLYGAIRSPVLPSPALTAPPITASIWAQVPGSTELVGDWQSLYAFRRYLSTGG